MKLFAIIVAGGSGSRMGTTVPKQFLELAGKPVLMRTIERFHEYDEQIGIIVVLPDTQLEFWETLKEKYFFRIPHIAVKGGRERFHSVKNGLKHVGEAGLVAIHDGVRPLVSRDTIKRCFETAVKSGNAVPVITPSDSVRMGTGKGSRPVEREEIKLIQTPQVFEAGLIINAYKQKYRSGFTDDATVLENTGVHINLVEGNRENIKITGPQDLIIAEALLKAVS